MTNSLINLFLRDLDRLKHEVESYKNESSIWHIQKDISNSGGTLALHLIGNLNHFIGAVLGHTDYQRNRAAEFSLKNISRSKIYDDIENVKLTIETTLNQLNPEDLKATYPINIRKEAMSVEQFLIHLYGHLNYHLGQINYHRRLCDKC